MIKIKYQNTVKWCRIKCKRLRTIFKNYSITKTPIPLRNYKKYKNEFNKSRAKLTNQFHHAISYFKLFIYIMKAIILVGGFGT